MRLHIPSVGDEIRLLADWMPIIEKEERNSSILEFLEIPGFDPVKWDNNVQPTMVLIPAGEILKIDRIYIRKGKGDFDSITFLWKGKSTEPRIESYWVGGKDYKIPRRPVRFWVRLECANKIEFERV